MVSGITYRRGRPLRMLFDLLGRSDKANWQAEAKAMGTNYTQEY